MDPKIVIIQFSLGIVIDDVSASSPPAVHVRPRYWIATSAKLLASIPVPAYK